MLPHLVMKVISLATGRISTRRSSSGQLPPVVGVYGVHALGVSEPWVGRLCATCASAIGGRGTLRHCIISRGGLPVVLRVPWLGRHCRSADPVALALQRGCLCSRAPKAEVLIPPAALRTKYAVPVLRCRCTAVCVNASDLTSNLIRTLLSRPWLRTRSSRRLIRWKLTDNWRPLVYYGIRSPCHLQGPVSTWSRCIDCPNATAHKQPC